MTDQTTEAGEKCHHCTDGEITTEYSGVDCDKCNGTGRLPASEEKCEMPTVCGHSKDYETCSYGKNCAQRGDDPCPLPSWRVYE